ncbi:hypothetical protein ACJX0J_030415, partial [Zea mays]
NWEWLLYIFHYGLCPFNHIYERQNQQMSYIIVYIDQYILMNIYGMLIPNCVSISLDIIDPIKLTIDEIIVVHDDLFIDHLIIICQSLLVALILVLFAIFVETLLKNIIIAIFEAVANYCQLLELVVNFESVGR